MLNHPTIEKLQALRLTAMAGALTEQGTDPEIAALTFEERLGLLADREITARADRRLKTRLTGAKLREQACIEDLNHKAVRGLDRTLVNKLAGCQWISQGFNVLITGQTGTGKTYLACALAQKACREGYQTLYVRIPRLAQDLRAARGDGRYPKVMENLAKKHLLVLDDWGLAPFTDEFRRDLLEIVEERYQRRATIITSQLDTDHWHDAIGDPTLADAILDRIIHQAYRFKLTGPSMRKPDGPASESDHPG